MNCYGDPAIASKTGTNIEKCKCDWLVVQALNRATPEQKEQLKVTASVLHNATVLTFSIMMSQNFKFNVINKKIIKVLSFLPCDSWT